MTGDRTANPGVAGTWAALAGALLAVACGGDAVAPPAALHLAFVGQPTSTEAGAIISPAVLVAAQDADGKTDTSFDGTVTLALAPGGALGGTTVVPAVRGVATFADLRIDPQGTAYRLSATASGLAAATSAPFDIRARAALTFASLSAGWDFACGVTPSGDAYCWGDGVYGEIGTGDTLDRLSPALVVGGVSFASVQAGTSHSCGVATSGAAYCWGWNALGQLGDGNSNDYYLTSPTAVVGGLTFSSVAVGQIHSCGLTTSGAAYCWGANGRGFLGGGINLDTLGLSSVPIPVSGGLTFAAITSGGGDHTCGLTAAGAAYCWGMNNYGELGDGTMGTDRSSPTAVTGGLAFAVLSAGGSHTCGVTVAGAAYCWGVNFTGQLGDGTTTHRSSPVPVLGGLTLATTTAGGYSDHSCGLSPVGDAYCWGYNNNGQLGDGTTTDRLTPVAVTGGLTFTTLTVGASYTCGLTAAGQAYCWGYNGRGRLGDGTTTDRHVPTRVLQ